MLSARYGAGSCDEDQITKVAAEVNGVWVEQRFQELKFYPGVEDALTALQQQYKLGNNIRASPHWMSVAGCG